MVINELRLNPNHRCWLRQAASRQWTAVLNETFATFTWYRDGWTKDRGIVGTATLVTHGESRLWDSDKHQ